MAEVKRFALTLKTPTPFSLERTVLSHGWVYLAPFRWEHGRLIWIQRGALPRSCLVEVEQTSLCALKVRVDASPALTVPEQGMLRQAIRRVLNLDLDLTAFGTLARKLDPSIHRLIAAGGGRLLRGTTLFEDLVKTLCTTNASWAHTEQQVAHLVHWYGQAGPSGRAFPSPEDLRTVSECDLRERCRMGYRAPFLASLVRKSLGSSLGNTGTNGATDESTWLADRLPGFGPYARAHAMVLLNRFADVPWDSEVRGYVRERFKVRTGHDGKMKSALERWLKHWGEWKFLAYKCERMALRSATDPSRCRKDRRNGVHVLQRG